MQEIKLEKKDENKGIEKILKDSSKKSNSRGTNGKSPKNFNFDILKEFFKKISNDKKKLALFAGGAVFCILLVAFLIKAVNNSVKPEVALGNLNNGGKVFHDGENVYLGLSEGLYKEKDNVLTKVSNDNATSIMRHGNAIYYLSSASQRSYDIKVLRDGTEEPEIIKTINTPINKIYVNQDNIYYASSENGYGIRRISIDDLNEGLVVLANIVDFSINGNTLYYTDIVGKLEKINLNKIEESPVTVDSEHSVRKFQVKDKWIYFYNSNTGGLCRIKSNGKSFELVNSNISNDCYNITNKGNIYFLDKAKTKICRGALDSRSCKTVVETRITNSTINIAAGNLYYDNYESETTSITKLFRVKTNGKKAKEIKIPIESEEEVEEIDDEELEHISTNVIEDEDSAIENTNTENANTESTNTIVDDNTIANENTTKEDDSTTSENVITNESSNASENTMVNEKSDNSSDSNNSSDNSNSSGDVITIITEEESNN